MERHLNNPLSVSRGDYCWFLLRTLSIQPTRRQNYEEVNKPFDKEIVHPHVLVRIPCYDFSPVSDFTMDPNIASGASSRTTFHAMTGGEYKTQEHIHRDMSDSRLLAIPTSWRRVAASNLDWDRLYEISLPSRVCNSLYRPLYHVCSPRHKGHADLTSSTPSSWLTQAVSLDIVTNDVGCAR